jgi:hypothetical protein
MLVKDRNMKKIYTLVCCLFIFGCQSSLETNNNQVKVVIENNGSFPEGLVGKWKANDESAWEVEFQEDGQIASAVIEFGKVRVIPGQISKYPTRYGGKGIFEPGIWKSFYEASTCNLSVEIKIKSFYQDIGTGAVEGSIEYILIGDILEDYNLWTVDWFAKYNITALLPEPTVLEDMNEPVYMGTVVLEKANNP